VFYEWYAVDVYKASNPFGTLFPALEDVVLSLYDLMFGTDRLSGEKFVLWKDSWETFQLVGSGMGWAIFFGLFWGLHLGAFPGLRAILIPLFVACSIIPPLGIINLLIGWFGGGSTMKIILIFFGATFFITRDIALVTRRLSEERRTKIATLGGKSFKFVYFILLPQVLPKLITAIKLMIGTAITLVLASEMIIGEAGLGYYISLHGARKDMAGVIACVIALTVYGSLLNKGLDIADKAINPWVNREEN
jgi:NitT/TauT family transport system permease protein